MMSHDSVIMGSLADDSAHARVHEAAVKQLLVWHLEATGSTKAEALLADWATARAQIAWVAKALLQYEDADAILAATSRKDLVEELAQPWPTIKSSP